VSEPPAAGGGALSMRRLAPGAHGLPRTLVEENQRQRLLAAAAECLLERGYGRISTTAVARAAGVSSATLYRHFDDIWACLLCAYEAAADRLCETVEDACADAAKGRAGPEAIAAGLALLAAQPARAYLLSAEPPLQARGLWTARSRLVARLVTLLRSTGERGIGDEDEARAIGGALTLIAMRARRGEGAALEGLAPALIGILLGRRASPTPRAPRPAAAVGAEPAATDRDSPFERLARFRELLGGGLEAPGTAVIVAQPPAVGDRVLDLGCGEGETTERLARLVGAGAVVGVDASEQAVRAAKRRAAAAGLANVSFVAGDLQVAEIDGAFDYVFSRLSIASFANPTLALRNVRRAMRPGAGLCAVAADGDLADPRPPAEPDRVRGQLEGAGFAEISIQPCDLQAGAGEVPARVWIIGARAPAG